MIKILVVEDEKPINDLIEMNLTEAGYDCTCVYDGIAACDAVEQERFDLVLLDIMLPGADGYEVLDYIKPMEIPVIFLTAKGSTDDKVKGLKLGADDYLTKPFEIVELLARVESVLRRYHKNDAEIDAGDLHIDTLSRVVLKNGEPVNLTVKEFDLLVFFIRNKNIALFRDQIYSNVWGEDYMGDSRTVDLHVQRLRRKLGWEDRITSVYKVGYRLNL
jgi:DNA-binding response OmpR family regulator